MAIYVSGTGTDITAGLKDCARQLSQQISSYQPINGSYEAGYPTVVLPSGRFRLTEDIEWGPYARIVSDGRTVLFGGGFKFSDGYMVDIERVTFLDCDNAVVFTNRNTNGARLTLRDCYFQNVGYCVKAYPATGDYFSSYITILGGRSHNCECLLSSFADVNVIENMNVQWRPTRKGSACVMVCGGRVNINGGMFVPVASTCDSYSWISHGGSEAGDRSCGSGVFCNGVSFHGEGGGLPIVSVLSSPDKAYPFMGPSVVMNGCQLSCGRANWMERAVVNLRGGLPQIVSVTGCCGEPGWLIRDANGDLAKTLASVGQPAKRLRYSLSGNTFWGGVQVPELLKPFCVGL